MTPEGLTAVGRGDHLDSLVLRYPVGVDAAGLEAELHRDYGLSFTLFSRPNPLGSIRNLGDVRSIAEALAAFLVVLAGVGVVHALVVATPGHRRDLAVLRALGFRRAQVRRAVGTAGAWLATVGAAAGVPIGLIAGRSVWRTLVSSTGAVADPQVPWWLVVVVPGACLGAVALLGWPVRRRATRHGAASILRTE